MKPKEYTIDELIAVFAEHSRQCKEQDRKRREEWPDSDHFEGFDIAEALVSICKKIKEHEDRFKSQDRQCFEHGIERCSECD